jgi:hypothetical protein
MRTKSPVLVVAFGTTTDAMAMEQAGKRHGLQGRLIPIPRQLSAGCGLAWREPACNGQALRRVLEAERIDFDGLHSMEL